MKVLLFSKLECVVDNNLQKTKLSFANPISIEEETFVFVMPLAENCLPFSFVAGQKSSYVKHTVFPDYILAEIVDFPRVFQPSFFATKKIENGHVYVIGHPYKITISQKLEEYSFDLPDDIKKIEIFENKNAVVLMAQKADKDFLCFFHKASQSFQSLCGQVDFSENSVRAVIPKNTLSGHGEVLQIDLSGLNPEIIEQEGVYICKSPRTVPPFLWHIAFFEAVKERDYNLAKTFLCDDLAKALQPQILKDYFGQFDAVKVLSSNQATKVALISSQDKLYATAKVYQVKFEKGKICDIQED